MDWQATDLNPTWGYAFLALGRPTPGYDDPADRRQREAWNKAMTILDQRLTETGAHAAGHDFTLADVVLGVSVHRWMADADRPRGPAGGRLHGGDVDAVQAVGGRDARTMRASLIFDLGSSFSVTGRTALSLQTRQDLSALTQVRN
jgi:glutathione S-transferase